MPEQETVQEPEAANGEQDYVPGEDAGQEEPYSAQILRQLHDDAGRLLERYDGMLPPLEHEAIRKFLEGYCEFLESQMTAIEEQMGEHHPDLPPLDGMEPVASEDEEAGQATPEEAAEKSEPEASETEEEEEEPEGGEKSLTPEQVKELRGKHKALPTPPHVEGSPLDGDDDAVGAIDNAEEQAGVQFEPHELNHLADAHGFLSSVVNQQEPWGEIHRQESYHHHRNLRSIAQAGGGGHEPGMEALDQEGMEYEQKKHGSYHRDASGRAILHAEPSMGKDRAMQILNARAAGIAGKKPSAPTEKTSSGKTESSPRGGTHHVQSRNRPTTSPAGVSERVYKPASPMPMGMTIPKKPTTAQRGYPSQNKDMDTDDGNDKGMEVLPEAQYKSAHHEAVGKTAGFLQLLSTLQDGGLGDEHRQYAAEHANGLESAMGSADGEKVEPRDGGEETAAQPEDDTLEPKGEIPGDEEHHQKSLMDETNEQRASILSINKKIVELAKQLG